jgi:hyperosmotically inducible periplasmic protein
MKTLVVALGLALGIVACSEPPPPPPKPVAKAVEIPKPAPKPEVKPEPPKPDPNKELAAKVKQTLEAPDSKLPSGAIDVTAQDGKVTLWGAVATNAMKTRAGQLAGKVEGVSSVVNELKIVRGS